MEWIWVGLLLVPIIGPLVWAVTRGRKGAAPPADDTRADTAIADVIKSRADNSGM